MDLLSSEWLEAVSARAALGALDEPDLMAMRPCDRPVRAAPASPSGVVPGEDGGT